MTIINKTTTVSLLLSSLCGLTFAAHPAVKITNTAETDSIGLTHYVSVRADKGIITQTNDFLRGINANEKKMRDYSSLALSFGWQTHGDKAWHHDFYFPSFGIGLSTTWLDNKEEIGQPISLYGFFSGAFWRSGAHAINYNIDAGLAFHWKPFDRETNPYNIAIGSHATVHLGLSAEYAYTIANRLTIGIGAGVTHFSNGAIKKPNKGMNLFAPQARLTYHLEPTRPYMARLPQPKVKQNEIDITVGYGVKTYECDTAIYHPEMPSMYMNPKFHSMTLQAAFMHRYCPKGKYGAGLAIIYDDLIGSDYRYENETFSVIHGNTGDRFSYGIFAQHDFCIGNLSIPIQVGYYLWQAKHEPPAIYRLYKSFQRAGLKYTLPCNIYAGVNIYAHNLSRADFIEWNIGYSLKFKKTCN